MGYQPEVIVRTIREGAPALLTLTTSTAAGARRPPAQKQHETDRHPDSGAGNSAKEHQRLSAATLSRLRTQQTQLQAHLQAIKARDTMRLLAQQRRS
jgi:hypothetical protein